MGKKVKRDKFFKGFTVLALSSSVIMSPLSHGTNVTKAESLSNSELILANLNPTQRQALEKLSLDEQSGLFLNSNVNLESSDNVSVIVEFKNKPYKAAVIEAAVKGKSLSDTQAKENVDTDHETFKNDLEATFKTKSDGSLKIKREYKNAFNGVALEVPANKLKELVKSTAVKAIYSDATITLEEPSQEETLTEAKGQGMAAERSYLKVNELHKEGFTGKGVKVAVLDTGVDYNHPDLKAAFKGGYDFIDNDSDPMEATYNDWIKAGKPGGDASKYVTEHGTHVSGTIAGRGTANSDYATTGIAPDADLYVYRVLGPNGGTADSVISGIDRAVADGMDIMNLSLGATYNDALYPTSIAINNAVLSGVTAVVAAGNSGDALYTLGSPGTAALALTVGASDVPTTIPTMNGHNDNLDINMRLLAKGFDDDLSTLIGKTYGIVNINGTGESANYNNLDVKGKVVLVQRGTIGINEKVINAKEKGAAAVLVYNNGDGLMPFYLAEGADFIPAFNLTMADGLALKQQVLSGKTTFTFSDLGQITTKGDELASFSSRGPARVTYDIKPEVVAPGVSVLSTVPGFIHNPTNPTDFTHAYDRLSGTSMATPFTSGVAALLLQAKPELQPEDVKAILMNTADPLKGTYSVFEQGAGRVNPYEAIHSSIEIKVKNETTMPNTPRKDGEIKEITSALNFGKQTSNGKDINDSRSVTFENHGSKEKTFDVTVLFQTNIRGSKDAVKNGVTVTTDQSVKVPVNSSVTRKVSLSIPATAENGVYEGYVVYTNQEDPTETYRVPFGAKHVQEEGFGKLVHDRYTITSDRNSLTSPLLNLFLFSTFSLKSHMRYIQTFVTDEDGNDLGFVGAIDGIGYEENKDYVVATFRGFYYPFVDKEKTMVSNKAVLAKEGHYKIKLVGYNDEGETFTKSEDIFVDNTMPNKFDIKVEGEKADNPFVEYKDGQNTLPFTATINDKIVDEVKAAGLKADQSQNILGVFFNSPFNNQKLPLDENGTVKDDILMTPSRTVSNVAFMAGDQATNAYGKKQFFFVKDTTPYVYGQPNVKTRLNQVVAHTGDTVTFTLTANNVSKIKQAVYDFTTNTIDTNIVSIKLNQTAKDLGGALTTTTTPGTGTTIKSNVSVVFNGSKEVTGDVPMVDVTIKISDLKDITPVSSFNSVTSTFTDTYDVITKPFTYIAPVSILQNITAIKGYVHPEGLYNAKGTLDITKDFIKAGAKVTIQDNQGKTYPATLEKNGLAYVSGLPVTKDEMTFIQDIPGHFTTYNKFNTAGNPTFNTMDGEMYGIIKTLGTETVDKTAGGDVNKDNVIDVMDALAIQSAWGTNTRSADINFDGTVDAKDFAYVEKNFGLQNWTITNAPKAITKYKGKSLEDIKKELGSK